MALLQPPRVTALMVALLLVTACGETTPPGQVGVGRADASPVGGNRGDAHRGPDGKVHAGRVSDAAHAVKVVAQPADATELRIAFERLLGQHATLVVRMTRARIDGDEAFARVAFDAVVTNTEQLTDAVGSIYGPKGGNAFKQLWSDHVTFFFDYTVGRVEDDADAMRSARKKQEAYIKDFSTFVESATGGELAAKDVAEGLRQHVDHLLGQVDAYAAEDYARALKLQRRAYAHMFPTGQGLAGGIAAQHSREFPLPLDEAPQHLRSALGRLLGEHVELAIDAMRSGVNGAPAFEPTAAALNASTVELSEAMEALFGRRAAASFNRLWADHVDAFVQYTGALAEGDGAGKRAAVRQLKEFHHEAGRLLGKVTGGELPAKDAARALREHDAQLVDQIEAYAAEDYETAYQIAFDAYQHVFDTAAGLSGAIEAHLGGKLPVGGARTGGGGMAHRHGD